MSMGAIFEWGANTKGQLGNKRKAQSENPLIVKNLQDSTILDISCSYNMSAVVTKSEQATESPRALP